MSRKNPVFLAVAVFLLIAFPVLAASPDQEIFVSRSPATAQSNLRLLTEQSPVQIAEAARQLPAHTHSAMLSESLNDQASGNGGSWVSRHKVLSVVIAAVAVGAIVGIAGSGGYKKKGGGNDPNNPGGGRY